MYLLHEKINEYHIYLCPRGLQQTNQKKDYK